MNPLPFILLLLITLAWALLPLLPALWEFFRPTDVEPLTMVGRDNADISRFARHFREYLQGQLEQYPPRNGVEDHQTGTLPDGTPFIRTARLSNELSRSGLPEESATRLVVLDQTTVLDNGDQFKYEVWAREDVFGSPRATYRAILGEKNVELGERSVILRWLHSVGTLVVGPASHLYGRASAEESIQFGREVHFERVGAPVITVGIATPRPMPPRHTEPASFLPPPNSRRLGDHLRVDADLTVPAGTLIDDNLVVAGQLTLGPGARVTGSVKSHRTLTLESGTVVEGSLVSRGEITIGQDCWIRGPVISEERLEIGRGTSIGSPNAPSTVSGRQVFLADGVTVSGQIVTSEGGQTAD
ncbi:MAG TPA: hypothetical protein VGA78_07100 [Gemmatimonadales bacterium]